jgi:hypothetical protein
MDGDRLWVAAGQRPRGGAGQRRPLENSKSSSRARFGTKIGSRGSEGASKLTEKIEAVGDAAKEEIGAGGSPAGGSAPGFNDDDTARERGETERRCGERRGSGSPFIGQRRKGRRRPRRWGGINARRRWSLVVVPFREMRGRGGGAGALKALGGGRERGGEWGGRLGEGGRCGAAMAGGWGGQR